MGGSNSSEAIVPASRAPVWQSPTSMESSQQVGYDGEKDSNGRPHGSGQMVVMGAKGKIMGTYDGQFLHGKKHGEGEETLESGNTYKGQFFGNKRNGKGVYRWTTGSWYEGEFKDDFRHGKGRIYLANGQLYDGQFWKGKMQIQRWLLAS